MHKDKTLLIWWYGWSVLPWESLSTYCWSYIARNTIYYTTQFPLSFGSTLIHLRSLSLSSARCKLHLSWYSSPPPTHTHKYTPTRAAILKITFWEKQNIRISHPVSSDLLLKPSSELVWPRDRGCLLPHTPARGTKVLLWM